jgi:hypothetical protein
MDRRGGKPATNCLSYGAALDFYIIRRAVLKEGSSGIFQTMLFLYEEQFK